MVTAVVAAAAAATDENMALDFVCFSSFLSDNEKMQLRKKSRRNK